jgi:3-oxoacid CoA-transferase subunit B
MENPSCCPRCSLPLTGRACVRRVITDLGWFEIEDGAFILRERAPGVSVAEIRARTAGRLIAGEDAPEMQA